MISLIYCKFATFIYPYFVGPPSLGKKRSYDFTTVSMSVGKGVFSKTAHTIFLKLLMKLGCLKGKKLMEPDFLEKISFQG